MTTTDTIPTSAPRTAASLFGKALTVTLGILTALVVTFLLAYLLLGSSGRVTLGEDSVVEEVEQPGAAAAVDTASTVSFQRPDPWWLTGEECPDDACIFMPPRTRA
jgi:hypothetical protein